DIQVSPQHASVSHTIACPASEATPAAAPATRGRKPLVKESTKRMASNDLPLRRNFVSSSRSFRREENLGNARCVVRPPIRATRMPKGDARMAFTSKLRRIVIFSQKGSHPNERCDMGR